MEEIILIQNEIEKVNFLNLFNDHFHDENHLKIGIYIIEKNKLIIHFDNQLIYTYDYVKTLNNIKYYNQVQVLNNCEDSLSIVHNFWEDDVLLSKDSNSLKRISNEDEGSYELNENSIIIYWNNYDEETFILNQDTKKYHIQIKNNYNNIYIKNNSWEEECYYDINKNILSRNNQNDKGNIVFIDKYLIIDWERWSQELFILNNNQYVNNSFFINNIKIYLDKIYDYIFDKNYIYDNTYDTKLLEAKIYKYKIKDIFLDIYNLNDEKLYELFLIDNIYHELSKLKNIYLDDIQYYIYFEQKILLDLNYIVIGEFKNMNQNIHIHFYNDLKNNTYELIERDNNYYLKEHINVCQIYHENKIHNLEDKTNYLISNNKTQLVFENNNEFHIYNKINDYYFNEKDYQYLKNCYFNFQIYNFFNEDYNYLIQKIEKNEVIFNQYSFEEKFLFLNRFDYLENQLDKNIFELYGFMFILDIQINNSFYKYYDIINIKINHEFKNNLVLFNDKFKKINQDDLIIFSFDDFSDYDYFKDVFELNSIKNRVILIDYSKCKLMKTYYYYTLLNHLCYLKNINIENKLIKQIENKMIEFKEMSYFINNKMDFILFCILLYITNI